jgi:hypothetical protein
MESLRQTTVGVHEGQIGRRIEEDGGPLVALLRTSPMMVPIAGHLGRNRVVPGSGPVRFRQ